MQRVVRVLDDPAVAGAVQSLLGREPLLHSHRYVHARPPGGEDQQWHKDDYRYLHTTRLSGTMQALFPVDILFLLSRRCDYIESRPTCVLPGCQYLTKLSSHEADQAVEPQHKFVVPASMGHGRALPL